MFIYPDYFDVCKTDQYSQQAIRNTNQNKTAIFVITELSYLDAIFGPLLQVRDDGMVP